jgi:hypothetical protein|tara:strand:- start:1248 stop:1463 length:216 start_codon:yes stop_codon:yes gene_type:complete
MIPTPFIKNNTAHYCFGKILCEIRALEDRLIEMGFDGDNAYENRLIDQYHDLIHQRRKALAQLMPKQPPRY